MRRFSLLLAIVLSFAFIQSCSKKDVATPSSVQSSSSQANELATARTTPAAGNYTVTRFVDDSIPSTRIFKSYVFTFRSAGRLIAKVDSSTYIGTWEMKDNNTKMEIDIEGTEALEEIDRGWDVVSITNNKISLNHDGQENVLVFTKQL